MIDQPSFRAGQPLAWTFHRGTSRWTYNVVEPPESRPPQPSKEDLDVSLARLPPPGGLAMPLGDAIRGRFSCRAFLPDQLSVDELGTILHAGYGVVGTTNLGAVEFMERVVPSGGGLYPLELYVL